MHHLRQKQRASEVRWKYLSRGNDRVSAGRKRRLAVVVKSTTNVRRSPITKPYFPRWVITHNTQPNTRKKTTTFPPPSRGCTSSQSHCQPQNRLQSQNKRLYYNRHPTLDEKIDGLEVTKYVACDSYCHRLRKSRWPMVDEYAKGRDARFFQRSQRRKKRVLGLQVGGEEISWRCWEWTSCRTRRKGLIWTKFWI